MVFDTSQNPGLWIIGIFVLFTLGAFLAWWLADRVIDLENNLRKRNRR